MRQKVWLYMGLLFFCTLFSCRGKGFFMPTSSGRPFEMLVVGDDMYWNSSSQQVLSKVINSDLLGLPQSEGSFKVMHASWNDFDHTLKLVRSIIIVEINQKYRTAGMACQKDVYASPQRILKIQAPDRESFNNFVSRNAQRIMNIFTVFEMNCQIAVLRHTHNEQVSAKVDSLFGCNILVPSELHFIKTGTNFIWASTNSINANQNFVMYSIPYQKKESMTLDKFMAVRDSFMRANIPGSIRNDYMTTDTAGLVMKKILFANHYLYEVRGLWRMKNDFMGGPFVSHIELDASRQQIYVTEIFLYAPDRAKSVFIHRLEASLFTLQKGTVDAV